MKRHRPRSGYFQCNFAHLLCSYDVINQGRQENYFKTQRTKHILLSSTLGPAIAPNFSRERTFMDAILKARTRSTCAAAHSEKPLFVRVGRKMDARESARDWERAGLFAPQEKM